MENHASLAITKKRPWLFYNKIRRFPHKNDIDSDSIKHVLQEVVKDNLGVNSITSPKVLKRTQQKLNQNFSAFTSNHTATL